MNFNLNEDTFFVCEIFKPQLEENGKYAYYLIEKKGLSHKQLKQILPIGYYCGIKDKNATTQQWFCTQNYFDINDIKNDKIKIEYKGRSNQRLHIGKHKGNKFKVKVEINEDEAKIIKSINWNKKKICNYFGEQRFDARVNEFAKLIEMNSFESALKFFLCEQSVYDSEKSSGIKKIIKDNWGDWQKIIDSDIPLSKKPIFVSLQNEKNFREAFHFVEKKSLKQMLKAIQSQKFNLMLHNEALLKKSNGVRGTINEEELILEATKAFKRKIFVSASKFEKEFGLSGMERKTFFQPKNFKLRNIKNEYWIEFDLSKGNYATVLLEFLKNYL